jgi:hypothetical protein
VRTTLAISLVMGIVVSGQAQAPTTNQTVPPERPSVTGTLVSTRGVREIRNARIRFGNGWELRADFLSVDGAGWARTPGEEGTITNSHEITSYVTGVVPSNFLEIIGDRPAPTEATLSGNVRLTIGAQ